MQYRNGWADGPAYITQCPIKTGSSYTYDFNVTGQRGTLWWHAHILWLRSTVYGAIVIMPKPGTPFPFPQPNREEVILLGKKLSCLMQYGLGTSKVLFISSVKLGCLNYIYMFCRRMVAQ